MFHVKHIIRIPDVASSLFHTGERISDLGCSTWNTGRFTITLVEQTQYKSRAELRHLGLRRGRLRRLGWFLLRNF